MLGRKEGMMIGIHTNIPGIQVLAGRSRQEMHERQKIHMSENAGVHFGVPRESVLGHIREWKRGKVAWQKTQGGGASVHPENPGVRSRWECKEGIV